jgi:hypothetical protein
VLLKQKAQPADKPLVEIAPETVSRATSSHRNTARRHIEFSMRFSKGVVVALLGLAATCQAFQPLATKNSGILSTHPLRHPASRPIQDSIRSGTTTSLQSTAEVESTEAAESRKPTKKDERLRMMKSDNFYRRGFAEVRQGVEEKMGQQFKSPVVDELRSSNFVIERDGVKVHLAKVCTETKQSSACLVRL